MQLIRELHRGMRGPDVYALKRALRQAGYGKGIILSRSFGKAVQDDLKAFQKHNHLKADGVLGARTFEKLRHYVDAYGRKLFAKAPRETEADKVFNRLLAAMHEMSDHTPGYLLGGGHGILVRLINPRGYTDCSSSSAYVLWRAGVLSGDIVTPLSWDFLKWGTPGYGTHFTVMSNGYAGHNSHVWIRLHKGRYWRFDTSPHGDGAGSGPRLRILPRLSWGFSPRHANWKGH